MEAERLAKEVANLRVEVQDLREQVARLSAALAPANAKPAKPEVSDEIATVIAAAVAAYMGHKARIKTIIQLDYPGIGEVWRLQGRMALHSSRRMAARPGA
jgi:methylmalonyl-CoA carboxyltransferase large subunit